MGQEQKNKNINFYKLSGKLGIRIVKITKETNIFIHNLSNLNEIVF